MSKLDQEFRKLHQGPDILRIPNAWDVASARLFEHLGAKAVATTSAGVAWSLGYADGNVLPVKLLAELTASIVRVVHIPVSVDVEAAYTTDAKAAGESIRPVLEAGAVGINIEDGLDAPEILAAKIESVRNTAAKLGIDLYINARTDVYLRSLVEAPQRVEETLKRAARYAAAGADSIFVPGLADTQDIADIVKGSGIPVALMAWPGLADAISLQKLGVRRLTAGSAVSQASWQYASKLAAGFLATGESGAVTADAMPFGDLQKLFVGRA